MVRIHYFFQNILCGGPEEVPAQSHKLNGAGSSPAPAAMNGSITQLVERGSEESRVDSSNLPRSANSYRKHDLSNGIRLNVI